MLDAVDHGDGKFESGVEGGGGEKLCHVDMGPQVLKLLVTTMVQLLIGQV